MRMAPLEPGQLKNMVRGVFSTHDQELSCHECFQELDRFADMVLAGKNAAEAIPLVQDHLDRCRDCQEEFKALLVALRAERDA